MNTHTLLDCSTQKIGIGALTVSLPPTCLPLREYLSQPPAPFTLDEMHQHWQDYVLEPECLFSFFNQQLGSPGPSPAICPDECGISKVYLSAESNSDMAVRAGKLLLEKAPQLAREARAIVYYSATLNSRPAWSTSCRLQYELGLKGADAFTVGQKGAISSFAALRVAAEELLVEDSIDKIILVGSERLVPPYRRAFSSLWLQGDSATAMALSREGFEYRVSHLLFRDFLDQPPDQKAGGEIINFWAEKVAAVLHVAFERTRISPAEVDLIIPPNVNLSLLRQIAAESGIPLEKFYLRGLERVGFLGTSDLVANLSLAAADGSVKAGDLVIAFGISADVSISCAVLRCEPGGQIHAVR